ncbi:hypothetical protein RM543_16055 [Roseicyclus sp. F158]|uniref:DUF2336 domain-containing protein n=1 Tax=Tropicimonas omnivorans TaxID=3075590 RepID=A0ABU3DKF6_9RHOB|nr:DUF6880 family protein [Roseicyclus sp. F158]MDT0684199.1 hypothetical protein [Roseicyclus sp. F158]
MHDPAAVASSEKVKMARKALNKPNLVELGADTLADLLLETVKGDAARQRRVRMVLSADQGLETIRADVLKRFSSIRRGRSFLSRQAQKKLAQELSDLTQLIETRIAPDAPDAAFDLLWTQLHLAAGIHERTDDSWGTIGDVMGDAMAAIDQLAPRLSKAPEALAEDVFEAVSEDGYGAFDDAVPALAEALGAAGLARLRTLAEAARDAPLTEPDHARHVFIRDDNTRAERALVGRNLTANMILRDVADAEGDVDSWLAQHTAEQLTYTTIAPSAATRLVEAGRPEEALRLVEAVRPRDSSNPWDDTPELDEARFACLEALGRTDDLRAALWHRFERHLCPDALRRHLSLLPDFEDIEAEEAARRLVLGHEPIERALVYCLQAPDLPLAAGLIDARSDEIDGDAYEILTPRGTWPPVPRPTSRSQITACTRPTRDIWTPYASRTPKRQPSGSECGRNDVSLRKHCGPALASKLIRVRPSTEFRKKRYSL